VAHRTRANAAPGLCRSFGHKCRSLLRYVVYQHVFDFCYYYKRLLACPVAATERASGSTWMYTVVADLLLSELIRSFSKSWRLDKTKRQHDVSRFRTALVRAGPSHSHSATVSFSPVNVSTVGKI
jgi:hypothetical protein